MTQATQPKVEWGFYAITPRIVRTQYKDLSHAEKWLYVCLKDLCGEKGMCYRTLRSLSEETNISIASLSSMIPNLQKAELIHAEKKKRSNSGKEVWHISIVDIWQANHEYCSKIEQSSQIVQNLNNDVQNLNEASQDCSENERVCSDFPYRRITTEEETITEERTIEEERDVADATARSQTFSQQQHVSFVDDEETKRGNVNVFTWTFGPVITPLTLTQNRTIPSPKEVVDGHVNKHPVVDHHLPAHRDQPVPRSASKRDTKPQRPRQQGLMETKPVEPELSSEATAIMDKWDSVNKRPVPRTASVIEGATLLIPCNPTAEELDTCKKWLFTTDDPKKPWFRKIGVGLLDVAKNFSKWQSLQEVQPGKEESNGYRVISSFDDPNFTMDGEFYPSEKEKKAHYAAHPIGGTRS